MFVLFDPWLVYLDKAAHSDQHLCSVQVRSGWLKGVLSPSRYRFNSLN